MLNMFRIGYNILLDGYLVKPKILCYGYVIKRFFLNINSLTINNILCSGYVIRRKM
jgi:hypothetical protein